MRTTLVLATLLLAAPAPADVRVGVEAFEHGDFRRAVDAWRPLAVAGQPDAQFNLGQAYRLGKGVPRDMAMAEDWFRRAAEQGLTQAIDAYGLVLFQNGKAQLAVPYLEQASARGDPRAQYVLGTMAFNGDYVVRDWVRAYVLLSRSSEAGLPAAKTSLERITPLLNPGQLASAQTQLAETRVAGLVGRPMGGAVRQDPSPTRVMPTRVMPPRAMPPQNILEQQIPAQIAVSSIPPVAASATSLQTAAPPPAGARVIPVRTSPAQTVPWAPLAPGRVVVGAPQGAAKSQQAGTASPLALAGGWRIQIGAFSTPEAARTQWDLVRASVPQLSGLAPYFEPAGAVTRLRAGGLKDKAAAQALCTALTTAGEACFVVAPGAK